jgi:hypothetical protein
VILTPRFVYIHQPKTGGTFVTKVLERLFKPAPPSGPVGRLLRRWSKPEWIDTNKHGTVSQIPSSHRHLPVVATVRDPFDRYVSQYTFAWWKERTREWIDRDALKRRLPHFPDISFEEFVDLTADEFLQLRNSPLPLGDRPGFHTEQFVRYFFRDPAAVWPRIDDAYIASRGWEEDLHPVRFLRQESLNADLHRFLLDLGLPAGEVDFVLEEGRIQPEGGGARDPRKPWREWYTPELLARVRHRERLLLAIFPQYDPLCTGDAGAARP